MLNCDSSERLACISIRCTLNKLRSNESAVIRVRSRVWNSTLTEEFLEEEAVLLQTNARLLLPPELVKHQNTQDDLSTVTLVAFPKRPSAATLNNIPTWIMLLAVLAGLAVVCIIAYCLYKCGFFRRKRLGQEHEVSAHRNGRGGGGAHTRESARGGEADLMISNKLFSDREKLGDEYIS